MEPNPRNPRKPDKDWTNSAQGRPCDACSIQDGTIIFAHKRAGSYAGMGRKTHDWRGLFLCHACHQRQEMNIGGKEKFWEPWPEDEMLARYRRWKEIND